MCLNRGVLREEGRNRHRERNGKKRYSQREKHTHGGIMRFCSIVQPIGSLSDSINVDFLLLLDFQNSKEKDNMLRQLGN